MKSILPSLLLASLTTTVVTASPSLRYDKTVTKIPAANVNGPVTSQLVSSKFGLDGPKLSGVNGTAWDWWYFDVVSKDAKSSVVVTFYTATNEGFPLLAEFKSVNVLGVYITFPNGTSTLQMIKAGDVTVTTLGDGSSGYFPGTGSGGVGSPDMSSYLVTVNSPQNNVFGTMRLASRAPAHYPCGPVKEGQNLEVGPNIGWANAVPDADGTVDFQVAGSKLAFSGYGYHDKNWSGVPFTNDVQSWYWGHGRLGPYSVVWFDFLSTKGVNYISSYLAKDGKILSATCTPGSVQVRPVGANSTYPPTAQSGAPGGFNVKVDVPGAGLFNIVATNDQVVGAVGGVIYRFATKLQGTLQGKSFTGTGLLEQFAF